MTAETEASPLKRREIIDALRIGAVPRRGLELFAVGLDRFEKAIDEELDAVAAGRGKLKAVRGEYGTGKTAFARWLENRALRKGFATTLVQISETETPLYRMETVYRRAVEGLQTKEWSDGAFRSLVDRWFFNLEEEVLSAGTVDTANADAVAAAVGNLLEQRLASVSRTQPQFAAALRACHTARVKDDHAVSEGLVAWLMGQPNVGAGIKRAANLKGDLDHDGAAGFIRGLLEVLKQTGRKGLVLVLDEVETIQRVRADSREKSLNALRALIDDLIADRYPGLYVLITGTPLFFDGPQGVKRSVPLAQRLHTEFAADPKFDSSRAPQLRLQPWDVERMVVVGTRIRGLYPSDAPARLKATVDDETVRTLAVGVAGQLGGKVGIAPRIFLKRLVGLLDQVEEHPDFDPRVHFKLIVAAAELTEEERAATGQSSPLDSIKLEDLGDSGPRDED
ncbi:MAG: BREX system ATP-binding protein BrxD [Deltaproteobacteria bacterium]|nr:BREX system ATP-binding protein BrxD [Deltaproteobacteria bacterium]